MQTPLYRDEYAIYLPAVNDGYAMETTRDLPVERPFPNGVTLRDLIFWEPGGLWYYPYLLHSVGLHKVGALPDNAVTQRNPNTSVLVGDSGGFQIGVGSLKGLQFVPKSALEANAAMAAWRKESAAREWIVGWLETHTNYAMTMDMPLWARLEKRADSPFHKCSVEQLIELTVANLQYIRHAAYNRTKWLNVVQGGQDPNDLKLWWKAVKGFRFGGWALGGSAGKFGGIAGMLRALLMMRDDGAFAEGQDWVHVLGVSTPLWAVLLTGIQKSLREIVPTLHVSFDSSSPFQIGGRYDNIALTPTFTSDPKTWTFATEEAPQGRRLADKTSTIAFPYRQSPIGHRLLLNHLNVRDGMWEKRNFDSVANVLLINHNIWVYLDAMRAANDLAAKKDRDRVPALYLDCLDFIDNVFKRSDWETAIAQNEAMLNAAAPSEYKAVYSQPSQ